MAIQNNVTSLLNQLAKQPMTETARQPSLSQVSDEEPVRSSINQKSFSGSGLDLELTLASGQEIELSIRINQAGGLSQLELASDSELSIADQEKLSEFLKQLSSSVADLFKGRSNGSDTFKFANLKGIEDIELNIYQDDGNEKQSLVFDKEGRGSGRKIEALWIEYDRANDVEERHDFTLTKQAKRDDQTAIYGQMNYQWLLDQVDSAMAVMDDKPQGKELAGFFKSGIQALFSTASSGSRLLQELGASAQQAKDIIGRSIQVLASDHKQMNALPDFNMTFSSQRQTQGSSINEYQLGMTISQNSDQAKNEQTDESYQTQNRRLRMDYQSARQQAIYEYTWTRDESLRNVFEGGNLAASHYRIEERIEERIKGSDQSQLLGETGSEQQREFKDRDDLYF
ncbi:MAG: hypothetical protein ACI9OH_000326 [Oleispira sp.]|jgi:hypothetical protein